MADAQSMGAIGVIRSLGRAGYPVHACARQVEALGLASNYASAAVVCPPYEAAHFLTWLRDYVAKQRITLIIPSESLLLALRPAFNEFAPLLPVGQEPDTLYRGMSKCDVFQRLTEGAGEHLPPSLLVQSADALPDQADLGKLGVPLFLKVDACYSRRGQDGAVHKAGSVQAAHDLLIDLRARYEKVLIQGYVPGRGVGVFFLSKSHQLLAEFMHRRLHEVPHEGGISSLRESVWLPSIREDALAKFRHLDWEGVAMLEYRWDPATDQFYFLELNGRFWGSLHLALFAGVDFPLLLADAFLGQMPDPVTTFPLGVRCRDTFPGEVNYVWSRLKARDLPLTARLASVVEFFLLSVNPTVYSDLLFPGDRKLYWKSFRQFSREFWRSARMRLRRGGNEHDA